MARMLLIMMGVVCIVATPTFESPFAQQSDFCVAPAYSSIDAKTLREAAKPHGILMGAALAAAHLRNKSDPQYAVVGGAQYSLATAENSCKFGPIHPEVNQYDFSGCDTVHNS
jgi:GH35 family endo-1,4-beta-xylanase